MEEKYYAHAHFEYLSGIPPHSITQSDFNSLRTAYKACLSLYWIEKKFEIVSDNYYEFEEEIKTSYNFIVSNRQKNIVKEGQKQVSTLNRRLVNLLCSIRMYRDQVLHDSSQLQQIICPDYDMKQKLESKTNELYDRSFAFQLMELLRNYTQHQGLIIERVTAFIPFGNFTENKLLYFVEANFNAIKEIEGYNKKIKTPIEHNHEWLNLIEFIREYYKCWIEFHNYLHTIISSALSKQLNCVYSTLKKHFGIIDDSISVYTEKDGLGPHFLLQLSYLKDLAVMYTKEEKINLMLGYISKECIRCSETTQVRNSQKMSFRCNTV